MIICINAPHSSQTQANCLGMIYQIRLRTYSSQLLDKRSHNGSGSFAWFHTVYVSWQYSKMTEINLITVAEYYFWPPHSWLYHWLENWNCCWISKQDAILREIYMQSLQEQHITPSEIVKLICVLYKKVILETTHCQREYVSSVFICPEKDSIYMLIRPKSLTEHVQYHYEMDQYSAIC